MRQRKLERCQKRQRGQFMTPRRLARDIVQTLDLGNIRRVLEPSCGDGSFLGALLDRIDRDPAAEPDRSLNPEETTIVGVEIDSDLLNQSKAVVDAAHKRLGRNVCHLIHGDFFRVFMKRGIRDSGGRRHNPLAERFDLIIGNPPFGGSFDPEIEDELDALFGKRFGSKIKKETYAFFIVACTELLRPRGRLVLICSDSLLTIPTMTGLRRYLMERGDVVLHQLGEFSAETSYPMLVLEYTNNGDRSAVHRFGKDVEKSDIEATPNLSWGVTPEVARLFRGPKLGDVFVASSGMTTGKNEYFVREISTHNTIDEPFDFSFYEAPVTVAYEQERARLNKLPKKKLRELREAQERGETERRLAIHRRNVATTLSLPDDNYRPYNKASGRTVYSPPTHVIYWKDDGDAVLTYKRTGNWYLRGVGGQPFFGREGLTWQLVASGFKPRYLPSGYILDSGAPCAFIREGVERSEISFVIGWLLSPLANQILKRVINHTMNIQSKDFERMPYPWWVPASQKAHATRIVVDMIEQAKTERFWQPSDCEVEQLGRMYNFDESSAPSSWAKSCQSLELRSDIVFQESLFEAVSR